MTTRTPTAPARLAAQVAAAVALAAGLVLGLVPGLAGSPASAHDGPAIVEIEQVHPAGLQIHYIVRVTWEDDGHPAEDATVTATAIAADGSQLTPVPLLPADDDGRYAGVVEYPSAGAYTVRVSSIEPTGKAERAEDVSAPAVAEDDPASEVTTAPDGAAGDAAADGGFAPADDDTGDGTDAATGAASDSDDASDDGSDDGGGMPVVLLLAAAAVVIIGAVTAVNIIRRNRPSGTAAGAGAGDGVGDGDTLAGDPTSSSPTS